MRNQVDSSQSDKSETHGQKISIYTADSPAAAVDLGATLIVISIDPDDRSG